MKSTLATNFFPWLEAAKKAALVPGDFNVVNGVEVASKPLARKTDPVSSKLAAATQVATGVRGKNKAAILSYLYQTATFGGKRTTYQSGYELTAHEVALHGKFDHPTVHKRLPDLRADGLVKNGPMRTCSVTRRPALTWVASM